MRKNSIIILLLITSLVALSGCTTKTATNGTFGEKSISLDLITISNNTTADHYSYDGTEYYYVEGSLINKNKYDAFNVNLNVTVYDANGNEVATKEAYLNPKAIPANGVSQFYVDFNDSNNEIVRYDLKVVNASVNI